MERSNEERSRILVLDLLETFARERDMDVRLERHHHSDHWTCTLMVNSTGPTFRGHGRTARQAVSDALKQAGVNLTT